MTEQRDIDSLRLHPEADKVPRPDASDRRALRASLSEEGQQDPIDITEDGQILDGRTRWELLRELGAESVRVRVQSIPTEQQAHYIIDRALARRNLTPAQKRVLNDLLREQVVEVRRANTSSRRAADQPIMRIGYSQTERAEKLGVDRTTVAEWDAAPLVVGNPTTRALPTHAVDKRGRPQPIHHRDAKREAAPTARPRPEPLRKARAIPGWSRHFSTWLRHSARPEDRDFLRRLDREIHAALDRNGIECQTKEVSS